MLIAGDLKAFLADKADTDIIEIIQEPPSYKISVRPAVVPEQSAPPAEELVTEGENSAT